MPASSRRRSAPGLRLGGAWMLIEAGGRGIRHTCSRLRPEVLDDDLLDMPVGVVEPAQRQERIDALLPRLSDANEDAGGERDGRFACRADAREPHTRMLVGRAVMRSAAQAQPCR